MFRYNLLFIYFISVGLFAQTDSTESNLYQHSVQELLELPVEKPKMSVGIASKMSENIQEAPSVVSVITREEIEILGALTLGDILNKSPSFTMSSTMFSHKVPAIRGNVWTAGQQHILLLIDGRPNRELMADNISIELRSFPISTIERIEIIRGPGSVLYGTNAFTGVINIVTKKTGQNETQIQAKTGNWETKSLEITQQASFSKMEILFAGKYFSENPVLSFIDETGIDSTFYLTSRNIELFGKITTKNWRISGNYNQIDRLSFLNLPFFPMYDSQKTRAWLNAGYTINFKKNWTADIDYSYSTYNMEAENGATLHSDNQLLEITNTIKLRQKLNFIFGGYYNQFYGSGDFHGQNIVIPNTDVAVGFYGQFDWKLTPKWKIISGFQWNKIENIKTKFIPRLSLIYLPHKYWSAKLLYGEAFRTAQALELSINYPGLKGNPNLTPETTKTLELQVSYRKTDFFADLTLFNSVDKNLINRDLTPPPPFSYINSGEMKVQGIELESKWNPKKGFFVLGNLSYQQNLFNKTEKNTFPVPSLMVKGGFGWSYKTICSLGFFDTFYGNVPETGIINEQSATQIVNPDSDSWHNISVNFKANIPKLFKISGVPSTEFTFMIQNLTDKKHYTPEFIRKIINTFPHSAGRTVLVGLNVKI